MHEFSVATHTVDKIIETALNSGAKKIREVEILIGELSLLGKDQLAFWMKEILNGKGDIAHNVKIDVKSTTALIKCNMSGYEGNLKEKGEDHFTPTFYCPSCNQGDIEIKKGRECILKSIQIEK